jgi:hypothetical protein
MGAKVIPLSDLRADPEGVLRRCYDSGQTLVVELPDGGSISIRPVEEDDDLVNQLIEHNPAFRELLAKSIASPRELPADSLSTTGTGRPGKRHAGWRPFPGSRCRGRPAASTEPPAGRQRFLVDRDHQRLKGRALFGFIAHLGDLIECPDRFGVPLEDFLFRQGESPAMGVD